MTFRHTDILDLIRIWSSNENKAVRDQYDGTWAMWEVVDDHKAVAAFLADKIIEHIESK